MKADKKQYPTPAQKKKIKIILAVLEKTGGKHKALACRTANISRVTLYSWIEKFDSLRQAIEDMNEEVLDLAETKLLQAVNNGEKWAIEYMLDRKGKDRGYTTRQEHKIDEMAQLKVVYED